MLPSDFLNQLLSSNGSNKKEFPKLETERLILRKVEISDLYSMYQIFNDADVQRFQSIKQYSMEEIEQYIYSLESDYSRGYKILWGIQDKSSKKLIGNLIIYLDNEDLVEIQSDLLPSYWNKGITKEAYKEVFKYLKTQFKKGVYAKINVDNIGILGVINSLGFKIMNIQQIRPFEYAAEFILDFERPYSNLELIIETKEVINKSLYYVMFNLFSAKKISIFSVGNMKVYTFQSNEIRREFLIIDDNIIAMGTISPTYATLERSTIGSIYHYLLNRCRESILQA